ncbi:MAG TPA: hypothetical protein VIU64_14440 [Polyangia bacterium]
MTSYFVTAGLPEDQIASISSDGAVFMHGRYVLSGSYSILHRGWKGIPIDDSMAYAALDAQGRSVNEQVYWPEIPGAVLAKASALQLLLADPVRRAAYVNELPAVSRAAVLAIRHTAWYWQGDFQARACCRGPNPGDPCFDEDGQLVRLPSDAESAPDAGPDGGAIDAGDGNAADGSAAAADTEPRIVCPASDTGIFLELPSGSCSGVGSCAIQIDNTCRPGLAYVSSTPSVFDCRCESGQWKCEVISGGLGLRPCGDAGS